MSVIESLQNQLKLTANRLHLVTQMLVEAHKKNERYEKALSEICSRVKPFEAFERGGRWEAEIAKKALNHNGAVTEMMGGAQ